jgi:hypothetical protein
MSPLATLLFMLLIVLLSALLIAFVGRWLTRQSGADARHIRRHYTADRKTRTAFDDITDQLEDVAAKGRATIEGTQGDWPLGF